MERLVKKYALNGICLGGRCDPAQTSDFTKLRAVCYCRDELPEHPLASGTALIGIMLYSNGIRGTDIRSFTIGCVVPEFAADGSVSDLTDCKDWLPVSK